MVVWIYKRFPSWDLWLSILTQLVTIPPPKWSKINFPWLWRHLVVGVGVFLLFLENPTSPKNINFENPKFSPLKTNGRQTPMVPNLPYTPQTPWRNFYELPKPSGVIFVSVASNPNMDSVPNQYPPPRWKNRGNLCANFSRISLKRCVWVVCM